MNDIPLKLLGSPVIQYTSFVKLMGSISGGMFLSHVYYWWKIKDGKWNYKFNDEFMNETGLSAWELRKAKEKALELKIIEVEFRKINRLANVPCYNLNKNNLLKLLEKLAHDSKVENSLSINDSTIHISDDINKLLRITLDSTVSDSQSIYTETTTENTSKITTNNIKEKKQKKEKAVQAKPKASPEVCMIFDFWKETMNSPKNILTDKRIDRINAILKAGHNVDFIKESIVGCTHSEWHMGKNPSNIKYNSIELICRSTEDIERFHSYYKPTFTDEEYQDQQRARFVRDNPLCVSVDITEIPF